jgi:hypothetical protein
VIVLSWLGAFLIWYNVIPRSPVITCITGVSISLYLRS